MPAVNGRVAKESTVEVIVTYGPLRRFFAGLRVVSGTGTDGANDVRDDEGRVPAGAEYDVTGRGMSGQEAVTMHPITPSAASHTLSATSERARLRGLLRRRAMVGGGTPRDHRHRQRRAPWWAVRLPSRLTRRR